jgi:uncharacterized membrane protein YkoI
MKLNSRSLLLVPCAFGLAALLAATARRVEDPLLKALSQSKHALVDGMQQVSKASEVAISAKFEMEDGKLSLSVYTAEKGLGVEAERNVLKEYAGDPAADAWKTEVEVFKDVEHVSRSAEQLTLMALSPVSLADIARKAAKDHPGTVYSITPIVRDRKAVFAVLVADKDKSVELAYDLMTGETAKATPTGYSKK